MANAGRADSHSHKWKIQLVGNEPVGILCNCGEIRPVADRDPDNLTVEPAHDWFKAIHKYGQQYGSISTTPTYKQIYDPTYAATITNTTWSSCGPSQGTHDCVSGDDFFQAVTAEYK